MEKIPTVRKLEYFQDTYFDLKFANVSVFNNYPLDQYNRCFIFHPKYNSEMK